MPKYLALLRGINVSGKNKIKMQELRQLLSDQGLNNVQTYIQSGNVVFESTASTQVLSQEIEQAILTHYGFEVPVLVQTKTELNQLIEVNPFLPNRSEDIRYLALAFLENIPQQDLIKTIGTEPYLPDEWQVQKKGIFLYCPNGFGRTKLTNNFFERKLKTRATTRNWKTILKLREMMS